MKPSLNLSIGTSIQVASDDNKLKYSTVLLGADQGKTLITRVPSPKQLPSENVIYDNLFFPGRELIFRLIADGTIYAFKTNVLACHHKPSQLLLTQYPEDIQSRSIRKELRYPCTLSCTLAGGELEGLVTNISGGGCQVSLAKNTDAEILKNLKTEEGGIAIAIKFPFNDDEHSLQAQIKSLDQRDQQFKLGLAFDEPSNVAEQYLNALQLQEMADFI